MTADTDLFTRADTGMRKRLGVGEMLEINGSRK